MFHSKKKQKQIKQIFSDQMHDLQDQLDAANKIVDPVDKLVALNDLRVVVIESQVKMSRAIYGTYDKAGNGVATAATLTVGSGIALCFIEPISGLILIGSGLGGGVGVAMSMRHFILGKFSKPYADDIKQLMDLPKKIQEQIDNVIATKAQQIYTSEKFLGLYHQRLNMRNSLTEVYFAGAMNVRRIALEPKPAPKLAAPAGFQLD